MWHRRKWVIVAVAAIAVVLVVGIVGGVVYAQTTSTPTTGDQEKTLLARVADILGIDQQKVEDAFSQAKKEMSDEALAKKLAALVEAGKLTQEQADQYKNWWESRPDVPNILEGKGLKGFGGEFRCFPGKMRLAPTPSATQ